MASTTRIPKAQLTGFYGAMVTADVPQDVRRGARAGRGDVAQPEGAELQLRLGRKAQKWNQCDESLKSFAHMAAASLVGCSFCLDLGYFAAHNEGLD